METAMILGKRKVHSEVLGKPTIFCRIGWRLRVSFFSMGLSDNPKETHHL